MSQWTHTICISCWTNRNPDRIPYTVKELHVLPCCFCGTPTQAGIYIREDPTNLLCKGDHQT